MTAALLALACCSRAPRSPFADLAARLPSDAVVLAGADLDRLRGTPLWTALPDSFRDGSYVLAAYTGADLATATRTPHGVATAGPAGQGAPADLLARAPDAPLWLVARGGARLPFTGNLSNINRLLGQTEYTVVKVLPGDRIEIRAEAICRDAATAQHLEENVRAISSLTRFPLEVERDGTTVRAAAAVSPDVLRKLF